MNKILLALIISALSTIISSNLYADGPNWVIFDHNTQTNYIDNNSITVIDNGIIRYWERIGDRVKEGEDRVPTYTLFEINCTLKTFRIIQSNIALEDKNTAEGKEYRTKLSGLFSELNKGYPSAWESIEPNEHGYARYNYICKRKLR